MGGWVHHSNMDSGCMDLCFSWLLLCDTLFSQLTQNCTSAICPSKLKTVWIITNARSHYIYLSILVLSVYFYHFKHCCLLDDIVDATFI